MKNTFSILAPLVFGLFISGCLQDADRENPLDSRSKDFNDSGVVSGQTLTFYAPFQVLPNVEVRLEPGPLLARSDSNGEFRFANAPAGSYLISASRPGYATDTASVAVTLGGNTRVVMNLDALPEVRSFAVSSAHRRRTFPSSDLFLLEFQAEVDDSDGINDVIFAAVSIPEVGFADTLAIDQTPGLFSGRVVDTELPVTTINEILGRAIVLRVRDRAGYSVAADPVFLARIISETPQTESPTNGEVLNEPNPLLIWRTIALPFDFTYRIEVVRVDLGVNTLVWSLDNVSDSETTATVGEALTSGLYFWTVSVVDEFGNSSRSKETSFRIN